MTLATSLIATALSVPATLILPWSKTRSSSAASSMKAATLESLTLMSRAASSAALPPDTIERPE